MSDFIDAAKIIIPGLIGIAGGYFAKRSEVRYQARKVENDDWLAQRRSHWSPLLQSAHELRARFIYLADIYAGRKTNFDPASLSGDFRELYMLRRDPIPNLQEVDPNAPRRDAAAVQAVRTRVCHELTFAESSVYLTMKYLGNAEHVRRDLDEHLLILPTSARARIAALIADVRTSLQGKSGAGIFAEQQEYIGETVWGTGRVITNLEFRKRLFDLPGWEQFANLLRFFVEFGHKINHEIPDTIRALEALENELEVLCASERKAYWRRWERTAPPPPIARPRAS